MTELKRGDVVVINWGNEKDYCIGNLGVIYGKLTGTEKYRVLTARESCDPDPQITSISDSMLECIDHDIDKIDDEGRKEAVLRWMSGSDTGLSSEAIALRWLGLEIPGDSFGGGWHYPYDGDDFGRCYRLLQQCPFIDIKIMEGCNPTWDNLVKVWSTLTILHEKSLSPREIIQLCCKGK